MAFDTVHVLRTSRRLSRETLETLALLLDFGACADDFFDGNGFSWREYRATRRLLDRRLTRVPVGGYVGRLRQIEHRHPFPGGGVRRHRQAQSYREAVIRLSLGMIAATALDDFTIDDGIRATYGEEDLETLYRTVMLCKNIDDVLDFTSDSGAGLPTFLTAHASPSRALALTAAAAAGYADQAGLPSSPHVFPFRVALSVVSALARAAVLFGRWRLRLRMIRSGLFPGSNRTRRSGSRRSNPLQPRPR